MCRVQICSSCNTIHCPVDLEPCEVVALFASSMQGRVEFESPGPEPESRTRTQGDGGKLPVGQDFDLIKEHLPCYRCRLMEDQANRLERVRLGRRERHVLLNAPPCQGESSVLSARGSSSAEKIQQKRSAEEGMRRAIRKLSRVGLVWREHRAIQIRRRTHPGKQRWAPQDEVSHPAITTKEWAYWRVTCRLSPLGQGLVDLVRADLLEAGKPLRWAKHRAAVIAAVRRSPVELLAEFKTNLERTMEWLSQSIALDHSPPSDSLDREKAQLIVDILEAIKMVEQQQTIEHQGARP